MKKATSRERVEDPIHAAEAELRALAREMRELAAGRVDADGRSDRFADSARQMKPGSAEAGTTLEPVGPMHAALAVEKVALLASEIERILCIYNSFDILATVSFTNMYFNPEKDKEFTQVGLQTYAEYVALLCLKRPFILSQRRWVDPEDSDRIQELVAKIFRLGHLSAVIEMASSSPSRRPGAYSMLQLSARNREVTVRGMAYPSHLHEVIRGLFTDFDRVLLDRAGFTSDDALRLAGGIVDLMRRKLHARRDDARNHQAQLMRLVKAFRRGECTSDMTDSDARLMRELALCPDRKIRKRTKMLSIGYLFSEFGDTWSFTAPELAGLTGLPTERTDAFLRGFRVEFGSIPADFVMPEPIHPLRSRPLMFHEDRYMSVAPRLLDWALRPALEETLKAAPDNTWHRYEQHRHRYLLRKSVGLMKRSMPDAAFGLNLQYPTSATGTEAAEIDAVGIYDTALFLVEAKGGVFSDRGRSGHGRRLATDIKRLVGDAHEQARRALSYVESSDRPVFLADRGTNPARVEVEKSAMRDVFLVSLTLEPLPELGELVGGGREAGLFQHGGIPWVVCLFDLMVMADMVEHPSQLPHYIRQRIRTVRENRVTAADELDFFGMYLQEGLYFEPTAKRELHILLNRTTQFDDYYHYLDGYRRTPTPKPRQPMPEWFEALLTSLERSKLPGRLDAAMRLLDLGGENRHQVAEMFKDMVEMPLVAGKLACRLLRLEGDEISAIALARGNRADMIQRRLTEICDILMRREHLRRVLAVGGVLKDKYEAQALLCLTQELP
ncbi:MAG TPA: hypothetical protein VMH22_01975 [bacterium]|nr:hypothetical protein [bacterium]